MLDWSFAPTHRSRKRFAGQYCYRPPPPFPTASPCPCVGRMPSGRAARATTPLQRGRPPRALALAPPNRLHRPDSPAPRTPRSVFQDGQHPPRTFLPRSGAPERVQVQPIGFVPFNTQPRVFSHFPHGTCALSDSVPYVSLGGKHRPFAVHYQALLLARGPPVSRARGTLTPLWPVPEHPAPSTGFSAAPQLRATASPDSGSGSSPFARRYSGRRFCFRLLLLPICLSSKGLPPGPPHHGGAPERASRKGSRNYVVRRPRIRTTRLPRI